MSGQNKTARARYRDACLAEYIKAGYAVFPTGGEDGKIPLVSGWNALAPILGLTPDRVPGHNFGVVLSDTDLVIDIDPRNFPDGDNPAVRLLSDIGTQFVSFMVRTGGGGRHIYLTKPAGVGVRKNLRDYPGIDFLSRGAFVMGAGSVHRGTGNLYQIAALGPGQRSEAPEALLALVAKTDEFSRRDRSQDKDYFDDSPGAINSFQTLAEQKEPAPAGCRSTAAYSLACIGKDLGLTPETCFRIVDTAWNQRCEPPQDAEDLTGIVHNAYKYGRNAVGSDSAMRQFDAIPDAPNPTASMTPEQKAALPVFGVKPKSHKVTPNLNNTVAFLTRPGTGVEGLVRLNQFTGDIEYARLPPWLEGKQSESSILGRAISDTDLIRLRSWLAIRKGYEVTTQMVLDAIIEAANRAVYHPIQNWLEALTWDGVKRLDSWLSMYAGAEDKPYISVVGRKFLCGAIARILNPGCKFDSMLVLEGPQGVGKSRLCHALGGDWYGDVTVDPHSRDTVAVLSKIWIAELSEMEVTRRADVAALKAFISRQEDKVRLAYGRIAQNFPRQCVFIGTINPESDGAYLKDQTGNRRFWPVMVEKPMDVEGLKRDRANLFAEALLAVRAGEKLYIDDKKMEHEARVEVAKRVMAPPILEAIATWLATPDPITGRREDVTIREIYVGALQGRDENLKRPVANEIAAVLDRLGWRVAWGRRGAVSTRVYRLEG